MAPASATLTDDAFVHVPTLRRCPSSIDDVNRLSALNAAFGTFGISVFLRHVPSIQFAKWRGLPNTVRQRTSSAPTTRRRRLANVARVSTGSPRVGELQITETDSGELGRTQTDAEWPFCLRVLALAQTIAAGQRLAGTVLLISGSGVRNPDGAHTETLLRRGFCRLRGLAGEPTCRGSGYAVSPIRPEVSAGLRPTTRPLGTPPQR